MKNIKLIFVVTLLIAMFYPIDKVFSQATSYNIPTPAVGGPNTPSAGGGDFLGWAAGVVLPLQIRTNDIGANARPIDFYTNNTYFLSVLTGGDLDVIQPTNGYQIGDPTALPTPTNHLVLWHNGDPTSIFVGVGAGVASTPSYAPGANNTLVGHNAGNLLPSTAASNVFVGFDAGAVQTAGRDNVFVGAAAGATNISSEHNTFIGDQAGYHNTYGNFNTFVGGHTGLNNYTGNFNTFEGIRAGFWCNADSNAFYGDSSGFWTTTGHNNSFFGYQSGITNISGFRNTVIGPSADCGATGLINASAIGAKAIVMNKNQMILGGPAISSTVPGDFVHVGIGLSGDASGPLNMLEINTPYAWNVNDPAMCGLGIGTGSSGLRFRDLTSGSTPCPPNNLALSVNSAGDVILVPGGTGFGYCNSPAGPRLLTDDIGILTNNHNVYFDGQPTDDGLGNSINSVGIGHHCADKLYGKLDVFRDFFPAGPFPTSPAAIYTLNNDITTDGYAYGVKSTLTTAAYRTGWGGFFESIGSGNGANIGVQGFGNTSTGVNYGGYFVGGDISMIGNGAINFGAKCESFGGPTSIANYGVHGSATGPTGPATTNIGVYGFAPPILFPIPLNKNWAGYFNGAVFSTVGYFVSDSALKQNIDIIPNAMNIISQLQPHTYTFRTTQFPYMSLPSGNQYGLIAQEVEQIVPDLVIETSNPQQIDSLGNPITPALNFKVLNYDGLIPILIAGMKQQQTQIDSLIEIIGNTEPQQLHQNPNGDNSGNNIDVTLSSRGIVLRQNDPNPFSEETTIEYFIPDDAQQVKIIFTDMIGNILKEVQIPEKGKGQLNVYASDLSSGIYTYTIVANGITIDSKRMVKTK